MDMQAYIDEIKMKLGGNILKLEIDDQGLMQIMNSALREIQRYINTTKMVTLDLPQTGNMIDLSGRKPLYSFGKEIPSIKVSSVATVYRVTGDGVAAGSANMADPVYASQLQIMSGAGGLTNIGDWALNYASWNTLTQIKNTMSTDLAFRYDKSSECLYINFNLGKPKHITVEYVPRFDDVSEIVSDYWIDKLGRLALAMTKITLGRIRTRYEHSGGSWSMDGQLLLDEGNTELTELREHLTANADLFLPID